MIIINKITLMYFTDPICSFCFAMDPILKYFSNKYKDFLDIKYITGGLLKDWETYSENEGFLQNPQDIGEHWLEVAKQFDMPINIGVWGENHLQSSYPASIFYKAVNMEDKDKAKKFLRMLKEELFFKGVDISNEQNLFRILSNLDINIELVKDNISSGAAQRAFNHDLIIAKNFDVSLFPTFIFTDSEKMLRLEGYCDINLLEDSLKKISGSKNIEINNSVIENKLDYDNFTIRDLCIIFEISQDEAYDKINQFKKHYIIEKHKIDFLEYYSMRPKIK